MSFEISNPFDTYTSANGSALNAGKLYIGVANLDPQTNPIGVFYDAALTIAAPQPIPTSGGYVWRNGAPARIYTAAETYSALALDKNDSQVFYSPNAALSASALNIITTAPFTGAQQRTQRDKNAESVSVKDFGAIGDGTLHTVAELYTIGAAKYRGFANLAAVQAVYPHVVASTDSIDWAAIQSAINYATGIAPAAYPYGSVSVDLVSGSSYVCSSALILKTGVVLSARHTATITGLGSIIIDTPASIINCAGVSRVALKGGNASVSNGLRVRNGHTCSFTEITVFNTQDQGVLCDSGVANLWSRIFVVNALLNRTRTAHVGAFELHDFDPFIHLIEAAGHSAGVTDVSSANLYCNAILAATNEGFWSSCIGEFGDTGIRITGSNNRFTNCRADTTMGHGIVDAAGANTVMACEVLNCAMGTTADAYDAYQNTSQNGILSGLSIVKNAGGRGRYGVNLSAQSEIGTRTSVSGVVFDSGTPNFIKKYSVGLGADGVPSLALASSGYITERSTSTTLDLSRAANIRLFPTASTSYSAVVGAVPGQSYIFVLNADSILVNGASIITKDGGNLVGGSYQAVWKVVRFFAYSETVIREVG